MVHQPRHRTGTSIWFARPRTLAGVAVAAAGITLAVWLPTTDEQAEAGSLPWADRSRSGDLADDFTGRRLDPANWSLNAPVAAWVGNGRLELFGTLTTRQWFTAPFGQAEARLRTSRATDVERAFTLLDDPWRRRESTATRTDGVSPTPGRAFHTYVIDWTPESVTWTVDGAPSLRRDRAKPGRPVMLALNLGTQGRGPGHMSVDFVTVRTGQDGPPTATAPPTGPQSPPASEATPTPPPTDPSPTAEPTTDPPGSATPSASPTNTAEPTPTASPSPTATAAAWAKFTDYAVDDLVTYGGATYRVLEAHTSLPGWEPSKVPSLFAKV
jgi:Glycosyl hydrolases family 16